MSATLWLRVKAFSLDYMWILAYLGVVVIFSMIIVPSIQELFAGSLVIAQLVGFSIVTLPVSLYFIISDSSIGKQSFGKKKVGIQVVDDKGLPLTFLHATFRTILKFLPWELSHYLVYRLVDIGDGAVPLRYYIIGGMIYGLMITYIVTPIFTKKKRSLYDIIARTHVVKV
ncbi:hypothetical protein JCM10914A_02280 [Paenibacillus sp. JCM 10914]|uniref:RDD family protein n=1 Tax=Paenibacillus sp. JCM 10914 TaxID=1236974 RepID=UPI0003CC8060|nr:RDD family protein [Paenibacillus sp. JCM 10914]GAE06841.1 hypothetical protein JCM10914_3027 [Paenibacillus sp. JCM 10914]